MILYLGCPIWAYKGWVGSFYPEGTTQSDFLREYARRLTTVEGNTTFYAVPAAETIQRWVEETPETFRLCPKLPRTISHTGKLEEHLEEAQQFREAMSELGERLGPMFLQLPPRYSPDLLEDLRAFLEAWPSEVRLAVEVRHPAWFEGSFHTSLQELLSENGVGRVMVDTRPIRSLSGDEILEGSVYEHLLEARERKPDLPVITGRSASFVFLRYIAHPEMEENLAYLAEWAAYLADCLREGVDAYVFCHCPEVRFDPWVCRAFQAHVSAILPIPPLPWDEADADVARQERLL